MSVLVSLTGQAASKNLASAEKMSLGGPNGVRAYPVGEATGDSGNQATAELRYIIPGFKLLEADVTVNTFFDWGQMELNEQPRPTDVPNKRSISGAGVGGSIGKEGDFIFRGSAAWSVDGEKPQADGAQRVPRVWIQAIKWF
jgi:hemolysin activation/secretion protein